MKRAAVTKLPIYLAIHAVLGALIGASTGAILVVTDVIGLAALAQGDAGGFILVPALAGLFSVCAAASALDLLVPDDGHANPGDAAEFRRAVRLRVSTR